MKLLYIPHCKINFFALKPMGNNVDIKPIPSSSCQKVRGTKHDKTKLSRN